MKLRTHFRLAIRSFKAEKKTDRWKNQLKRNKLLSYTVFIPLVLFIWFLDNFVGSPGCPLPEPKEEDENPYE